MNNILVKKISSKEILEILSHLVGETIPKGVRGNLSLEWDDQGGVEVFFLPDDGQKKMLS